MSSHPLWAPSLKIIPTFIALMLPIKHCTYTIFVCFTIISYLDSEAFYHSHCPISPAFAIHSKLSSLLFCIYWESCIERESCMYPACGSSAASDLTVRWCRLGSLHLFSVTYYMPIVASCCPCELQDVKVFQEGFCSHLTKARWPYKGFSQKDNTLSTVLKWVWIVRWMYYFLLFYSFPCFQQVCHLM